MSDRREQWEERDRFWPKGDPSPFQGPDTQGGRVNLPQPGVTDDLRKQVPETE
jgi:hypothetical protein